MYRFAVVVANGAATERLFKPRCCCVALGKSKEECAQINGTRSKLTFKNNTASKYPSWCFTGSAWCENGDLFGQGLRVVAWGGMGRMQHSSSECPDWDCWSGTAPPCLLCADLIPGIVE